MFIRLASVGRPKWIRWQQFRKIIVNIKEALFVIFHPYFRGKILRSAEDLVLSLDDGSFDSAIEKILGVMDKEALKKAYGGDGSKGGLHPRSGQTPSLLNWHRCQLYDHRRNVRDAWLSALTVRKTHRPKREAGLPSHHSEVKIASGDGAALPSPPYRPTITNGAQ